MLCESVSVGRRETPPPARENEGHPGPAEGPCVYCRCFRGVRSELFPRRGGSGVEGAVFSNEEGGCVLPGEGAAAAKGGEVAKIDGGDIELRQSRR